MVKEEKNRFKLNKESKRSFDTSKKKRSFDITKEKDEVVVAPVAAVDGQQISATQPSSETKKGKRKVIWLFILLFIVGGVVAYMMLSNRESVPNKESNSSSVIDNPTDEIVEGDENNATTDNVDIEDENIHEDVSSEPSDAVENKDESSVTASNTMPAESVDSETESQIDIGQSESASMPVDIPLTEESVRKIALDVIRGDYGCGIERINNLGANYNRIQQKVNQLYAEMYE